MSQCLGRALTPLQLYASSLASEDEAPETLFPMYTVPVEVLLEMVALESHEDLKARGKVVVFSGNMGSASFISHQWVAKQHPDPEFRQMQVLQQACRHLLSRIGSIHPDFTTQACVYSAKGISFQEFQSRPLFLWYDYFSVPQLSYPTEGSSSEQAKAINCIPAYIAKCRFFFALCPTMECSGHDGLQNSSTWARRGWCRIERAARELSAHDTWVLMQSPSSFEVVGTAVSFVSGSVGEGDFTMEEDRTKLAPVMKDIVRRKLMLSLQAGDFPAYRRHLNLQSVHFRGLVVEPIGDIVPGYEKDPSDDTPEAVVAHFLYQNGLTSISGRDSAGWCPLHYAAMSGNNQVVEGLLLRRANPNRRTSRDVPKLGFPPLMSALDLAVFYKHNDVAAVLIAARAQLQGGLIPAMHQACFTDNAEGIRLICAARGDPTVRNIFGSRPLQVAAGYESMAALEQLLQTPSTPGTLELSRALHGAAEVRGLSAQMVARLVEMRADVNFQHEPRRDLSRFGRLLTASNALQYRLGRATALTATAYHLRGRTALMAALQSAQYQGAAALIAAGARLDIQNCQGWTAADFAIGQSVPGFLQQGLNGDPSECDRVSSLDLYLEL
ncbi:Asb3 [Symbiodinium natans]|uniref:Asb3 protein n=1 Tax=Symbiodinium natans TaxID=878477 RepID=A0A812T8R3_9DINO|nr:Asb3 [Symbiodinium natans]